MAHPEDPLDAVLSDHEQRRQDEARRLVERAIRLEADRKKGAEYLRSHVLKPARDVAERLKQAGHGVVYQEYLASYPPAIRLHLWPKLGPMEEGEPRRATLEISWGGTHADLLCARRWSRTGLGDVQDQAAAAPDAIDELWTREQLLTFVKDTLESE